MFTCSISLASSITMTYIDRAATRRIIASTDSTHVVEDRGPPKIVSLVVTWQAPPAKLHHATSLIWQAPPAKLHHATRFSYPFWLISVSCVLVYGTVLPWNNVASAALQVVVHSNLQDSLRIPSGFAADS